MDMLEADLKSERTFTQNWTALEGKEQKKVHQFFIPMTKLKCKGEIHQKSHLD